VCARSAGNSRPVVNVAGVPGCGRRAGQMKLVSAGIIIGAQHQIYRKKSAGEHYRAGAAANLYDSESARNRRPTRACYQANGISRERGRERERERERERGELEGGRAHPFPERCSGAFHACMEIIKIKWPITNDCCKEGSPPG